MSASTPKLAPETAAASPPGVAEVARRARQASRRLATLSNNLRNEALLAVAKAIEAASGEILAANEYDCRAAEPAVASGTMAPSMRARLRTDAR